MFGILIICLSFYLTFSLTNEYEKKNHFENGNCKVFSTNLLLKFGKDHQYSNKIPKIIHYVYKTGYIPSQYSSHVKNCMEINKDAKFVFWNDFVGYRLIVNHFQSYLYLYNSYFNNNIDPLKISDVIRYFILYKFGGIYMDLDTKCQKSFDTVMINGSCILSQEVHEQSRILYNLPFLTMNSLMASISNHDFFKYILGKLIKADGSWIIEQTGPMFLTKLFKAYQNLLANVSYPLQSVTLADPYLFSPHTKNYLEGKCSNPSGEWKIKGCKDLSMHRKLQQTNTKDAVVVHLFMHLGYNYAKVHIKQLDNVCAVFKNMGAVWS